jgi:glucosamine--fructose-6-phosphate aminotransferase (isomerizing)
MCGIFGILNYGNDINTLFCILQGLEQLQNRGYDSVGICAMDDTNQNYLLEKYASTEKEDALIKLKNNFKLNQEKYTIGIGHNRWATHGAKMDHNAHPHCSNNKDFIIVLILVKCKIMY